MIGRLVIYAHEKADLNYLINFYKLTIFKAIMMKTEQGTKNHKWMYERFNAGTCILERQQVSSFLYC